MTTTERLLDVSSSLRTARRFAARGLPGSTSLAAAVTLLDDVISELSELIEDIERAVPGTVTPAVLVPSTWVGDDDSNPDAEYDDRMAERAATALGPEGIV